MIYYAETNLITIIVGAIILYQGRKLSSRNETSQIVMTFMLEMLILFSFSDIAAYWFRGRNSMGVEFANTVYFMGMALGTYAWFLYIMVKMGYSKNLQRTILYTGLPMFLLCVSILLNFLTHFYFTVDENHLYHRGTGIYVTWIVEWGYMIVALVINIKAVVSEKRNYRRKEFRGYLYFALPIAAAALCQMLFYGTTTTQVGYAIAILLAFLNNQHYQVQRDDLTGLNNKNAFLVFQDNLFSHSDAPELTLFMADADRFKSINDLYGHLQGDNALKELADALKSATDSLLRHRPQLFRYGGDEFIIACENITQDEIQQLLDAVQTNLDQCNAQAHTPYTLSASIGYATAVCRKPADFEALIKKADEAMYLVKNGKKAVRG